jgi:hypothetical protein
VNLVNNRSIKIGTLICSAHLLTVRPTGADCSDRGRSGLSFWYQTHGQVAWTHGQDFARRISQPTPMTSEQHHIHGDFPRSKRPQQKKKHCDPSKPMAQRVLYSFSQQRNACNPQAHIIFVLVRPACWTWRLAMQAAAAQKSLFDPGSRTPGLQAANRTAI